MNTKNTVKKEPGISYIYALLDPNTLEIKYIGKSINPALRLINHKCNNKATPLYNWIRSLGDKKPILKILCKCKSKNENKFEKLYITKYKKTGVLLNQRSGGDGWNNISDKTYNYKIGPNPELWKKVILRKIDTKEEITFPSVKATAIWLKCHDSRISEVLHKRPEKYSVCGYYVRFFGEKFTPPDYKRLRPVKGVNIKTGEIIYFRNGLEAGKSGFSRSAVYGVCNQEPHRLQHKGYKWSYCSHEEYECQTK